jgi:hypothetical protein
MGWFTDFLFYLIVGLVFLGIGYFLRVPTNGLRALFMLGFFGAFIVDIYMKSKKN